MIEKLETRVAGLQLAHPIMNASGILGYLPEHADLMASWGVSAIVSKTFTKEPREGYNPPIVVKLYCGSLLNAVGLSNPGKAGLRPFVESAKKHGVPVIVSVGGISVNDFTEVAIAAEEAGSSAIELNMGCPHFKGGGLELGRDPAAVFNIVKEVSSAVKIPVIVKLGLSDRIVDVSVKALEAGARALTLINTVRGMVIDVYSLKPLLTNVYGGLSGKSIHPIAVWAVYSVYKETLADIIGVGGVFTWKDAAELILAGSRAVQVGTALVYRGPNVVRNIVRGLNVWLRNVGGRALHDLVGAAHKR
ncbi:MAG: dihydroorotate dehydrogenase PyrD [Sulfolobales archaeon]